MDSWSGAQRHNLSVVIYHTLFSHNEAQFHQMDFKGGGGGGGEEGKKREFELKNFILQRL